MITDAELLKLVMDRFPEADTDGIVEQFSLLKVGLLQANAKLAVGDVGQQGVEEQSLSATDEAQAPKKRYTRRSLVAKPEEAIGDNAVQCCICGNAFQNLTIKHIQLHGLTVEEYKKLCGYGPGQKLISRNLLAKLQENVQKAQNARHRSQQQPDEEQPA